jgi:hypothetical protein
MNRRSTPQREIDDRAFPVRMLILVPKEGFGVSIGAKAGTIDSWLDCEIGRGEYAHHSGGGRTAIGREATAFYFRTPDAAARFVVAFPQLELADGTTLRGYTSPSFPLGRPGIAGATDLLPGEGLNDDQPD